MKKIINNSYLSPKVTCMKKSGCGINFFNVADYLFLYFKVFFIWIKNNKINTSLNLLRCNFKAF